MEPVYKVSKLDEGVWSIDEGQVRMFVVEGSEKAVLIDAGFGGGDLKNTVSEITDKPLTLLITHADGDHIGACHQFEGGYIHDGDVAQLRGNEKLGDFPLSSLREGMVFDLGGRTLEVIEIPGHTAGSVAFLDRANRQLFSGDTVQAGPIFMFGDHRNLSTFIDTIEKLIAMGEAFDTVFPAHNTVPMPTSCLPTILEGAKKLLAGELTGRDPNMPGRNCLVYRHEDIAFLY